MSWLCDQNIEKVHQIKNAFIQTLYQLSNSQSSINYYDFLLAAKKLNFRFQQANHLMALKNYFIKSKNCIDKRKIVQLLLIHSSSVYNEMNDKIIVKFNLQNNKFDIIHEAANEQQQYNDVDDKRKTQFVMKKENSSIIGKQIIGSKGNQQEQKIDIIVTIKLQQMQKKINLLAQNLNQDIFSQFDISKKNTINFSQFKLLVLKIFKQSNQKIKISEEDIKTIFFIIDKEKTSQVTPTQILKIKNTIKFYKQLRQFYKARVNPALIKNTEFKRGKSKNNIQIFQVKAASTLQFQILDQKTVFNQNTNQIHQYKNKTLKTKPSFGPLNIRYPSKKSLYEETAQSKNSLTNSSNVQIFLQRQRIEKILKVSKQRNKQHKNEKQTIANKLRSLFIHKVILPRQKMLDQEKQHSYKKNLKGKIFMGNQLLIKPTDKK